MMFHEWKYETGKKQFTQKKIDFPIFLHAFPSHSFFPFVVLDEELTYICVIFTRTKKPLKMIYFLKSINIKEIFFSKRKEP